jgi:hypothetical protein
LGLPFGSVDIVLDEEKGQAGFIHNPGIEYPRHGHVSPEVEHELERRIISRFMGVAAEAKYTGKLRLGTRSG